MPINFLALGGGGVWVFLGGGGVEVPIVFLWARGFFLNLQSPTIFLTFQTFWGTLGGGPGLGVPNSARETLLRLDGVGTTPIPIK